MTIDAIIMVVIFFAASILYMELDVKNWIANVKAHNKSFFIVQGIRLSIALLWAFIAWYWILLDLSIWGIVIWHVISLTAFYTIVTYLQYSIGEAKFKTIATLWILLAIIIIALIAVPIITTTATYEYTNDFTTKTDELMVISTNDINIITEKTAIRDTKTSLAQFPDTSRYTSGSIYKQSVNGEKLWVSPINYESILKAWGDDKFIPGYITIDVTTTKGFNIVNDLEIKYSPSAIWDKSLFRHIHYNYPTVLLYKEAFELDDNNNPYWIVPYGHFAYFRSFEVVDGVFIVDPMTGEINQYTVDNVPEWVNTVYPANIAENYCKAYGENSLGFFSKCFFASSQFTLTTWTWDDEGDDAWSIFFDADGQMWYASDTTNLKASERTMVGYILMSARTGEILYNDNIKGINGNGICQNFLQPYIEKPGWVLAEPTLYSIDNIPTWFSTIVDENGAIQMYCFGTTTGEIATDTSFQKALSLYRGMINSKGNNSFVDNEYLFEITGNVFRINCINDNTYIILDQNRNLVITVPDAISVFAKMTIVNDNVNVKYSIFENEEAVATEFTNNNL